VHHTVDTHKGLGIRQKQAYILTLILRSLLRRRGLSGIYFCPPLSLQLFDLLRVDAHLNREDSSVKFGYGKPETRTYAGFPVFGDTFFGENWGDVCDVAAKNGEDC
jgi:hypothetical protein